MLKKSKLINCGYFRIYLAMKILLLRTGNVSNYTAYSISGYFWLIPSFMAHMSSRNATENDKFGQKFPGLSHRVHSNKHIIVHDIVFMQPGFC